MHLICGEALYDVFVGEVPINSGGEMPLRAVAGGSPFNVAVGLARLGMSVAFASDLARDRLGDKLAAQLALEGVDDRFGRRAAASTALAIVATDTSGHPSYSFSGLEQATYAPLPAAIEKGGDAISAIHLGSIATVLPNSANLLHDLASQFANRTLISFDPNVRLSIEPDVGVWDRAIERLRQWCQLIKVSEEDIKALYGDADAAEVCRGWVSGRTALVVLTRGEAGATMFTAANAPTQVPAAALPLVVDTVGAGDSFMAALLASLHQGGWTSAESLAALSADQLFEIGSAAAMAAAITCSRRGPVMPTTEELAANRAGVPTSAGGPG